MEEHIAKRIDPKASLKAIQARKKGVYPSERHEIAMEIAVYFKEPYNNWVRYVLRTKKYPALIRSKFNDLKGMKKYKAKDKVKALMAFLR